MWPFTSSPDEDMVTATQKYYKHQLAILERELSDSSSEYKRLLAAKNDALKLRADKCKSLEEKIEEQRLELQRFRCIVTAEENLKRNKELYSSVPREGSITELERLKLELLETKEERNTRTLQALRVYQAEAKDHLNKALEQCRRENDKRTDRLLKEALVQRFSSDGSMADAAAGYDAGGAAIRNTRMNATSHLVTLAELSRLRLELEYCYRRLEPYEKDARKSGARATQAIAPSESSVSAPAAAPALAPAAAAEATTTVTESQPTATPLRDESPAATVSAEPAAPAPISLPKDGSDEATEPAPEATKVTRPPVVTSPGAHSGRNGWVAKSVMRKILLSYVARNHCTDVLGLAAAVLNFNVDEKELAGLQERDNGILGYLFSPRSQPDSKHSDRFIEKRAARRLLVGYMESVRAGNKTKAKNILAVMDDILTFTNDERTRIGMMPKARSSSTLQALATKETGIEASEISDRTLDEEWVKFLLLRNVD